MKILVTGGAGYIGSVVVEKLIDTGTEVVVLDNLSTGHIEAIPEGITFHEADLLDREVTQEILRREKPDAVIHMAAKALVGESMTDPGSYFQNNVTGSINLFSAMVEAGTDRIVFSSTAAVYGQPKAIPISEAAAIEPTNPYGESKQMIERVLDWYSRIHGVRYGVLRYFNAAGATERNGEEHEDETHLIPLVLRAAASEQEPISIFGTDWDTRDGTCVRDYVHVADLADAHLKLLPYLQEQNAIFNLGCGGNGYTVREVIEAAERVTGRSIPVEETGRRPGDPAVLIASSERIRLELGWEPQLQDIDVIVGTAWRWMERERSRAS